MSDAAWEDLVCLEWRHSTGQPSSVDGLDALEAELGVVLPAGVRWLDQQAFVVYRRIQFWRVSPPLSEGLPVREEVAGQPCGSTSERVAAQLGQPHWWTQFDGFEVVEPWLSKLVVLAIDEYSGTYVMDFHFDAESPPVLYCNWSEGSFPDAEVHGNLGYMQFVADSFEDFLALPG